MGMGQIVDYSQFILQIEKAIANGVASLDSNAKVPKNQISLNASDVGAIAVEADPTVSSFTKGLTTNDSILTALNASSGLISSDRLPSYVDDVLSYAAIVNFPVVGETSKIYVAEDTNKIYRWSGSSYVEISSAATADTALKLSTPRTISTTGDATYSVSFDGSTNVSSAITLANSGVTAGTYNALATQVRPFTVDAKGRITGVGTPVDIAPPWSAITGTPTTLSGYGITNALPLSGGTVTGVTTFSNATPSTSTTTGAVVVSGGLGVGGAIFSLGLSVQGRQFVGGGTDPYVPTAGTSLIAREVGDTFIGVHNPGGGVIIIGWDRSEDRGTIAVDGSQDIVFITDMSTVDNADNLSGKTPKLVIKGGGNVGIGTASPSQKLDVNGSAKATSFFVGANQVVSAQRTGYTPSTGTLSRGAFNTETVTLLELARQFHALRTDLTTHGLIGA